MTRDPKNGADDGNPKPFSQPPPIEIKRKEAAQAFSNVTNSLSDCSPNDRPMSESSMLLEDSAALPDSVRSTITETSPVPKSDRSEGASVKSTSVNVPQSQKTQSSEYEESEESGEEEESEYEEDEESGSDEDDESIKKPTPKKSMQQPPSKPGIIYQLTEQEKLEQSDPKTGSIKFWHNTAPMRRSPRLFTESFWRGFVTDEGLAAAWPPPDPPVANTILGPLPSTPPDEYFKTVTKMSEEAMENPSLRVVQEFDRPWPDVAFARINDLDRALTDVATLIVQQAARESEKQPMDNKEWEENRAKNIDAFMVESGAKGMQIGDQFGKAAEDFMDIAYTLDTVAKMTECPHFQSSETQADLLKMKKELREHCDGVKSRLLQLKSGISEYSFLITVFVEKMKKEDSVSPAPTKDDDQFFADLHRAANIRINQLKEDIRADSNRDKMGLFQAWYDQSRLRRLLDHVEKESIESIKSAEHITLLKSMKPPPVRVDKAKLEKDLKYGQFGGMPSMFKKDGDQTPMLPTRLEGAENDDFYDAPEPKPMPHAPINLPTGGQSSCREKPKSEEAKSTKSAFDFYCAPEPAVSD